ncbi:polycomb protein Asx [Cydia amplana]|uniref:polycomb protein Asx n=1 Tax=Cydia amplana TaxID=1869771 RepID=UPI002FE56976
MELDVSPANVEENDMEFSDNSSESKYLSCNISEQYSVVRIPEDGEEPEPKSSKHSSRKQSKRRKKSSNHSRPLPRIIVKPLPPPPPPEAREWTAATTYTETNTSSNKLSTMREVLASIPGFCLKPRKRSGKKLSTAAQLQQTREGCIDLETPDSILVNTNIRALLNKHTFSLLPPLYQYKLGQLLPSVDRPSPSGRLSSSSLNNEFFARACLEWQESLSGGEFTPENQQKIKSEVEKEKSKIDPWKLKHFEPFWGEKFRREKSSLNLNSERPSLKTTIKLRPTASITSTSTVPKIKKSKSSSNSKRLRNVGAVTRSSAKADEVVEEPPVNAKSSAPVPDLLPLKHAKSQRGYVECQVDFNFSDSSSAPRLDDSVPSTPVDPLLLPDAEAERSEVKQELDLNVVKIEDTSASKENEINKTDTEAFFSETAKRLSDDNDNENCSIAKRIRYEDEEVYNYLGFLTQNVEEPGSNNCSDGETNDPNDQICPSDEHTYPEQDQVDTNSEDSKATASVYEYDERSVSSLSSLKIDNNVSNIVTGEEANVNNDTLQCENSATEMEESPCNVKEESKDSPAPVSPQAFIPEQFPTQDKHVSTFDIASPQNTATEDVNKESYHNQEINSQNVPVHEQPNEKENEDSCDKFEKIRSTENIVHNYYDEHFKDAESFILETGGLSILTSQCEDVKYASHPNLMELSSYMSETNVTAVVTMPMPHNSSIPIMEVTNTSMVSYPDDNMQDPAKPKTSAVSWKTENNLTNDVITLHNFSNANIENSKYLSEDSKTSMEDTNMNEDNCMYKEDRDANFNMESSNSSESCQSMKDGSVKLECEPATSLVSSTTATNPPVSSTTMTNIVRPSGKKSKSGKESNRSRSSNKVPPGAVNLERSYQICQAVIQNSPNRDALRGQLRPPPALLTRPARAPRPPPPAPPAPPPPPVLLRQLPVSVMPHNEMNDNRANNMGQYILVQRTPNVAPRASSAPPANQNTNVSVTRCRSVGADDACVCNLRAMILCKKCGAFCHDDCIGSAELCLTCLIR